MTPTSQLLPDLAACVDPVHDSEGFSYAVRDFLDRFRNDPRISLLEREPRRLTLTLQDDGIADAYLASVAASLAHEMGCAAPSWASENSRALERPYFAARSPGLRAILLQESPVEFRIRNLFVSANALSRA